MKWKGEIKNENGKKEIEWKRQTKLQIICKYKLKYYCNALLFLHAIFTNFGDYHDNNMYRLNDALQDANNKKAEQSEAMLDFEKQCMNIKHNHCICCRMVGINLKINKNSICEKCAKLEVLL